MRRILVISIVIIAIFLLAWKLYYYPGSYSAPEKKVPLLSNATYLPLLLPSEEKGEKEGTVLIDIFHAEETPDLSLLESKIEKLGYSIEYARERADLEGKIRKADSLILISPYDLSDSERKRILEFARKGGRILLLADPDSMGDANEIAMEFGLLFEKGYLYDLEQNLGNYRYLELRRFGESALTSGVLSLALHSSCPIEEGTGIAFTSPSALSFGRSRRGPFSPIALSQNGTVLGICDTSFFQTPFNEVKDNDRFLNNIASYLTSGNRSFTLSDYHFLTFPNLTIYYANESLLKTALALKNDLDVEEVALIKGPPEEGRNFVELNFYNSTNRTGWIEIDNKNNTVNLGSRGLFEQNDSSLAVLEVKEGIFALTILSDSPKGIGGMSDLLISERIDEVLIEDNIAFNKK